METMRLALVRKSLFYPPGATDKWGPPPGTWPAYRSSAFLLEAVDQARMGGLSRSDGKRSPRKSSRETPMIIDAHTHYLKETERRIK